MLQVKSVGSLLKCKHMYFFADLQMMTDKAGEPQVATQLEDFPGVPAIPTDWVEQAYSIYHASVQDFRQNCSTDMVTHCVRADRWGWLAANNAEDNSEQTFPTAMASSQTTGNESVGALGTCKKKSKPEIFV